MKKIFVILLLSYFSKSNAQISEHTNLVLMQGIWSCYQYNTEGEIESITYKIVKGRNCLDLYYEYSNTLYISLSDMLIGFQDSIPPYNNSIEEFNISILKENGTYYTEVLDKKEIDEDGIVPSSACFVASNYTCDGAYLTIAGAKPFDYQKTSELSSAAVKILYNEGKKRNHDYIKEYLDIKVSEIKTASSILYSEDKKPTKIVLKQGEVVIIKEEKGDWIKIAGSIQRAKTKEELARDEKNKDFESQEVAKFIDEDFEGWVKKSDVK